MLAHRKNEIKNKNNRPEWNGSSEGLLGRWKHHSARNVGDLSPGYAVGRVVLLCVLGLLLYKLFSGLRQRERLKEDKRKAKLRKQY